MVSQRELTRLHEILTERFDLEELRTLCFRLGIDYDNLRSEGKSGKARELVVFLEHHDRIGELIAIDERLRPDEAWDVEEAAPPQPTPIPRPDRSPPLSKKVIAMIIVILMALILFLMRE